MTEFTIWGLISFISCFLYQLALFRYATSILDSCSKKIIYYILFALVNSTLVFISFVPFWYLYIVATIILFIEFKLISKSSLRQNFAGATMFTIHVSSIHFSVIAIYAAIADILPKELLENSVARQQIMTITFIILLIVLLGVSRIIKNRDIKRVTSAKLYSELLSSVSFIFVVYFSIGIYIYFIYDDFPARLSFVIINTVMILSIMYFILLFIINFVNMHEYKRFADELGETYSIIQHQKSSLSAKAQRDDLTNLYNRKFVNQVLDEIFSTPTTGFGLLYIDINRLKYVNDNFGHNSGDKLILFIADALTKVLRDCDVSARIGGDEFLVVIENIINEGQLNKISYRINELISIHDEIEDFPVSVSVGGVFVNDDLRIHGIDNAIAIADENMRKNKAYFYEKEGRYVK